MPTWAARGGRLTCITDTDNNREALMRLKHPQTAARNRVLWSLIAARYSTLDLSHDRLHVSRVHQWALKIAASEGLDVDLAGAVALVHDLVEIPKDQPGRNVASRLSAEAAVEPLRQAGYSDSEIKTVVEAVSGSSWSAQLEPSSPLGAVVQDADRLDAIGAIGIARCFVCAQSFNTGDGLLYEDDDPFHGTERPLDDTRHAVDHFYVKLLKLSEGMHTDLGRNEAKIRHETMKSFLNALSGELHDCQGP